MVQEKLEMKDSTTYEKICKIFGKIPIPPWETLRVKYKECIEFANLEITPEQAFSTSIFVPLLLSTILLLTFYVTNTLSFSTIFFAISISLLTFYYLLQYPIHYSKIFRVKASSEMMLAIIYMTVSMKISPNLERAVKFAAENLRGPLALDLKKMLWKVYADRSHSFEYYFDKFIEKWKVENSEFSEALDLIKSSLTQSPENAEKMLDQAVNTMTSGTKERMKKYVLELNTPLTLINSLGILLPILALTLVPIASMFIGELFHPLFLVLIYNIFLPVFVYLFAMGYLERVPYSWRGIEISKKYTKIEFIVPFLITIPLLSFSILKLVNIQEKFSLEVLAFSTLLVVSLFLGIFSYFFIYSYRRKKIREEISLMEDEFSIVLFRIGQKISSGLPIEIAIEEVVSKSRQFKITKFFQKILFNIRNLGMSLERAIFDEKEGAIKDYPSYLIENVMRAVLSISKRGSFAGARAMIIISTYLKNLKDVEMTLREVTAETTSTLELQGMLLAPLATGIVISLSALILKIGVGLGNVFTKLANQFSVPGLTGIGSTAIFSLWSVENSIPFYIFELIVGVYLIEVILIIGSFVSFIKFGDDKVMRSYTIARFLFFSILIFPFASLGIYKIFEGLINFEMFLT